jgi:hypothetical protein
MQFILSEEEYRKLIHKDRIKQPIEEFKQLINQLVKAKTGEQGGYGQTLPPGYGQTLYLHDFELSKLRDIVQTLCIKLDL